MDADAAFARIARLRLDQDESASRPPLRFDVGSAVLFNNPFAKNGWYEGKVIAHWYRGPDWEDQIPTAAYLVLKIPNSDDEQEVCAPG